ncbi:MAG: type I-B CRISPR-associated protein Cas5 [Saprospiraceae bacterium]|nr:type I-B CRISPR-associated protein Cas5 [Saprospiraceae bacterium]
MTSYEFLLFELSGEYGHFRKYNTTSSPLTYSIPTRLAVVGILGAVLGIEREIGPGVYPSGSTPLHEIFTREKTQLAIQVVNPIQKVNVGFNLLDTGKSATSFFNIQHRTQIEFELLKHPKYRIFFTHADASIYEDLAVRLRKMRHYFTPYLGLSQFTASLEWLGKEKLTARQLSSSATIETHSAINMSQLAPGEEVVFHSNTYYTMDNLPMAMRMDRTVTEYGEVLIERNGQPITLHTKCYWESSFGKIRLL